MAHMRNHGIEVQVARFHNTFGPEGTWRGGREKSPSALCHKGAQAPDGGEIEIWGDGKQPRSFLCVDECMEGVRRLMDGPLAVRGRNSDNRLIRERLGWAPRRLLREGLSNTYLDRCAGRERGREQPGCAGTAGKSGAGLSGSGRLDLAEEEGFAGPQVSDYA